MRLPIDRPTDVLPAFLLPAAATAAARVPAYAAAAVALWLLATAGRIDPVVAELRDVDPETLSEATSGGLGGAPATGVDQGLMEAVGGLARPAPLAAMAVGGAAVVVVAVLARSVAAAATQSTALSALRDRREPLADGVAGVGRHWRAFLGLTLLRWLLLVLAATPLLVGVASGVVSVGLGIVGSLLGGLVTVVAVVAVSVGLTFAGPAVVTDDVGTLAAAGRSFRFVVGNLAAVGVYIVVAAGVVIGVAVLSAIAGLANAPRVVAVASVLLVGPVLTGFSVALYAGVESTTAAADQERGIRSRLRAGFERGLRALGAFVRDRPTASLAGAGLLAVGIGAGYLMTAGYGLALAPDRGIETFGLVPIGPFVNITANNWLVAATGAFSGVFAGVPAAATLLFNGVIVGLVAGVFEPTTFLALVAPHGIVELPAIAVAGGAGLRLGVVSVRGALGRVDAATVAAVLRETWWILVGLAIVFVVAGAVEAFLTPVVAEVVL